ncbi:MAG: hypothetical protein JNK95_03655 [Candidatus Competibacter sp.]|nr:hypothetical protein [Candidatus Competibacter sp.]MDG4604753.1 hypothetical protein [Candidatus Contendobacter sp.]HRD48621.1 hypothetical protein [Candidatus Contendobacter sp.]
MDLPQPIAIHLRPGSGAQKYPKIVHYEWAQQTEYGGCMTDQTRRRKAKGDLFDANP